MRGPEGFRSHREEPSTPRRRARRAIRPARGRPEGSSSPGASALRGSAHGWRGSHAANSYRPRASGAFGSTHTSKLIGNPSYV